MEEQTIPIGALLKRIHTELEKRANRDLQENDLTFSQMHMLGVLDRQPEGAATLKELERYFCTAQSTVAGIAVRLERKGLVAACPDVADRRVKRIRITEAGRALCRRAKRTLRAGEAQMLSNLTPEEQAQLHALLLKVYAALRGEEGCEASP